MTQGPPDRRARLHARPQQRELVYGPANKNNLMYPLHPDSNGGPHGMIWPYTPTITYNQAVEYNDYGLTHVNQTPKAFTKTQNLQLEVSGDFTAQNQWEARYMFSCLHFLRTVTKMEYGRQSQSPGAPPPILLFSAHGDLMFDRLPVIIENFNIQLTENVDYVRVPIGGTNDFGLQSPGARFPNSPQGSTHEAWVPSMTTISVTLTYQLPPRKWVREFNYDKFKTGELLKGGGGWI